MKCIEINKAYQNNLKGLSVKIPLGSFTVVCGLSGSGKSSLAFETLYAEGQRRYLQNFSNYLKQYIIQQTPPHVESIHGLPPAIALEQKNSIKSNRSTVASFSGISDYLRLIFEKLAKAYCPKHNTPLERFSPDKIPLYLLEHFKGEKALAYLPLISEKITHPKTFLKVLRQKGFRRLLIPKNAQNISLKDVKNIDDIKTLPKKTPKYILLDRFVIEKTQIERLTDSFTQAFNLSKILPTYTDVFSSDIIVQTLKGESQFFSKKPRCPKCQYEFPLPITASLFNSNSPLGACHSCEGYGSILSIDEDKVIPNPKLSIKQGAIHPFQNPSAMHWNSQLKHYCQQNRISLNKAWCDLPVSQRQNIWKGKGGYKGIENYFQSLEQKRYKAHIRILLSRYKSSFICRTCKGSRRRGDLKFILFHGKNFSHYMKMNLSQMKNFFDKEKILEKKTCPEAFSALSQNLKYLNALGLSYLNLNRSISSLSGGEFQRLNLSSQLGLCLSQVLYVLDEPTVGLHPRDTSQMIELLKELQKSGNTVVVVEHDKEVIEQSDYIIEMGPGSGGRGGEILCFGPAQAFFNTKHSNTAPYLKQKKTNLKNSRPVNKQNYRFCLWLKGCTGQNLKNIDFFVPLNRFVVVTGVSGSGKSSLVAQTLYPALRKNMFDELCRSLPYKELTGSQYLKDVVLMNQADISKSSRSSVISYIKAFDIVRNLFSETALAKRQGLSASHFSLNVEGGRCPSCKGRGYQEIDMVFMDPLKTQCETCKGKKFKKEMLQIKFQDKNIYEVLSLTVDEGRKFFKNSAPLLRAFSSLKEVGLSYLNLGQTLGSLSGGERQRLKLSRELLQAGQEKTLYILDEPTKGLHFKELELLLQVINRLIETGGSFLVIEHNLDFIQAADFIIDMGPEAGRGGGQIIFEGTPTDLLSHKKSHTGQFLRRQMETVETKK